MYSPKEFLTRNRFAKLFSVVLATLLWITIARQANSEIGIVIPLEYRNIPSRLEIVGDTANNVEIRLRGPAALIREISSRDVSATVDLGGLPPGEKIVQLNSRNVRSPFGIEVVRVSPAQVKMILEPTMSKTIPVKPRLDGEPAPGYVVQESTVVPLTVEIQGPESKVRSIQSIPTTFVRLAGRKSSFTEVVDLDLPDAMLRLLYMSPVEVHVKLREQRLKE